MIEVDLTLISEIIFPLLVILVCGFAGHFFAKLPGFIAGINIGVLIAVIELGIPEYTLIILAIIDVLIIFGDR